MKVSFS